MYTLAISFYYQNIMLSFISAIGFEFTFSIGVGGLYYVYMNEVGYPFTIGICFAFNYLMRTINTKLVAISINYLDIYWTPLFFSIAGLLIFVFIRPAILETRNKSVYSISQEYAQFRYNIFTDW